MPNFAMLLSAAVNNTEPSTPAFTYVSTGKFQIAGYTPSHTYAFTLVTGTGAATLNTATGVVTLSSTDARFSVTAKSVRQITSAASGYVERKAYTWTADTRYTVHQNTSECGPGPDCSCHPGWGPHWDTSPEGWSINAHCSRDVEYGSAPALIDQTGSGYINGVNEWMKIS